MNGKKKIIYIIHDLKIGGVETALLTAIPLLIERYDFRLICLGIIDPQIKEQFNKNELDSIMAFSPYNPVSFVKVLRYISKFQPDLMLASLWRANLLASVAKSLRKSLIFISFNHNTRLAHLAEKIVQNRSVKLAEEVWTDSSSTATFIQARYHLPQLPKIISFLIRAVPANEINFSNIQQHRFLFVGRVIKIKRIDLIILFAQMLKKNSFNYKIDIFGPDEDNIWQTYSEKIIQENLNITYHGPRPYTELAALYTDYHHYVQFSDYEGMSISVVEAMMSGLVCFVRPVGEIKKYSSHLVSAVHLQGTSEKELDTFFTESRLILNDGSRMANISKSAKENWQNILLYKEDLINNIDRTLGY
ncbi:glycosyltransferase family 4 protein [Dyadobacter frigoris]|uniref:Glycosyltransferase family 4 protein n=1 Tax=Dyadobacter frigoris TaxID=2576211 RepID=A0A4U6DAG3_9BACT|nr:glycosyltransferase family 4 protein [Dyadobacter frigoris]TKT93287.1 glycosyltransferase family 4 protein [Dyadobacter frigoris]